MNYIEKIKKIDELIKNKDFDTAEQELLNIILSEKVKKTEDEKFLYFSFYNYIESLIYWRKYQPRKKMVSPENNIAEVYYLLGFINFEKKDYEKAMQYLDKAIEWNPISPQIRLERADTYRKIGKIERFKAEVEKTYQYIYNSIHMSKYYRELGWYYSEKRIFDVANALYTESIAYLNTSLAKNELNYIAEQENREPRYSTVEEIKKLFMEYNIPFGISKETVQIIYEDSQLLLKEGNNQLANYLYKVLYEITLDKRFLVNLGSNEANEESLTIEKFFIDIKEEFENNGITQKLAYLLQQLSFKLISDTKLDPFWGELSREVFKILIISNLIQNKEFVLQDLVEQTKDEKIVRKTIANNLDEIKLLELQEAKEITGKNINSDKPFRSVVEIINKSISQYDITDKQESKKEEKAPLIMKCIFCNQEFKLNWIVPESEKTFYCKCPNCNAENKYSNPNYKG